jgi:hypothetical protein
MSNDNFSNFKTNADKIKGRVNNDIFTFKNFYFGMETLLFKQFTAEKYLDYNGEYKWKVDLILNYRNPAWNYQINKETGYWGRPYNTPKVPVDPLAPTNKYTYGRVDFTILFKNKAQAVEET